MKITKPIAVHVDRLAGALAEQGIDIKRTKILELAAAAFGYHNTHECTAASQRGDLSPAAAEPVCRVEIPSGEALIVLRDPVTNAPYAIDESFIEQVVEEERRETYGPSPYGRLLDLSRLADHAATAWRSTAGRITSSEDGVLRILVELETEGVVTAEVVRSNVHQAIHNWRGAAGLSADDDEGFVGEIMTRVLPRDTTPEGRTSGDFPGQPREALRDSGGTSIHVAIIHHKHGIDLRLGTTLASVSRQVGEYVRENWFEAWEKDQAAERKDRIGLPEEHEGLDDDKAEEMYFAAMSLFDPTDYVEYEVIKADGSGPGQDASDVTAAVEALSASASAAEPFPGVPDDLWEIFAARDGDTFRTVFRVAPDADPEKEGRILAARSFGLKLEDYHGGDGDEDLSVFDGDLDGIEIYRADFDANLKAALEMSWEAGHRLPEGDPLRERIRQQVMDAMPRPDKD
ncbi:hypothetical protein [Sphingomonas sp. 3-13AW]|uniref:hypothetical protein n=1 Tax=Sphingomonas sp. 3-13AW TaxID=3050450 RepID=UPI003BB6A005